MKCDELLKKMVIKTIASKLVIGSSESCTVLPMIVAAAGDDQMVLSCNCIELIGQLPPMGRVINFKTQKPMDFELLQERFKV